MNCKVEQAEAIVSAISRVDSDLVRKSDLATTKAELQAAINSAVIKLLISQIAIGGLIVASIKLLA